MNKPEYQSKNGAMSLPEVVARTVLSSKTLSTRLSPEELEEVEQAAQRDGSTRSEWMRAVLLREARKFAEPPFELLFEEVIATQNLLTNYLVASAQVAAENKQLSREDVLQMIQFSNGQKKQDARRMVEEWHARSAAGSASGKGAR
jgi:uncharacterized protein (DUF1778 family)